MSQVEPGLRGSTQLWDPASIMALAVSAVFSGSPGNGDAGSARR
ncbi:hypothetical protein [Bifidobacterium crudilactis]|nr:hypothetical protein [Bifidobacterium crudilactis]